MFLCCAFLPVGLARAQSGSQNASASAPASALPANWTDAVQTLASRIVALTDESKPASLEATNISSLNATEVTEISAALQAELSQRLHLVPASDAQARIVVTLSQGEPGYVWVAQVDGTGSQKIAMISIPSEGNPPVRGEQAVMSLQRKIVWSQREPFLDFAAPDAPASGVPQAIVLETARIVSYESRGGQWTPSATIALHPAAILPRDARGMIRQSAGELEALLPGEACSGTSASVLSLSCTPYPSTNPEMNWPLAAAGAGRANATFRANRNFFDGLNPAGGQAGEKWPAFYTAADIGGQGEPRWVLAELDGKSRLYGGSTKAAAVFSGWGDDIAAIQSGCRAEPEILATGTGDGTQPDHIQIYEIRNRQAIAAGQPLDFPGPIFALWPSTDLKSARVVSQNLQTGMYEASIVTVSCGD